MPFDVEDNVFLLAGPVKMHPRVVRAMAKPAISHRSPEFKEIHRRLDELLAFAFQTRNRVVTVTGSGTAGLEAAVSSTLRKSDKVVVLSNGKFGERIVELARLYATPTVLEAPWGKAHDPAAVAKALDGAKALLVVHNETSTGFTNPLQDYAAMARERGALVIADVITSLGGIDVPVDAWGVDVAITGSQKCVGAPPGLAFVSVSPKAREAMRGAPGLYLNLGTYLDAAEKDGEDPFTPATHLVLAAVEGLTLLQEEGLPGRFRRVHAIAAATRQAFAAMGLALLPDAAYASDTVTAVRLPAGVDDKTLRGRLKERGVVVAGGQGALKGKILRVGHMGTVDARDVAAGLVTIEAVLVGMGAPVKRGAAAGAFEPLLGGP